MSPGPARSQAVAALLVVLAVGLAACASGAASPAAPATDRGASQEPSPAKVTDEGVVVVSGPPGTLWRDALMHFNDQYPGIQVEYTPLNGRDFWPRVALERQGGQFLWDVRVGGTDIPTLQAKAEGMLDPIRPLFSAAVRDDSKWLGGLDGSFADTEKQYVFRFLA